MSSDSTNNQIQTGIYYNTPGSGAIYTNSGVRPTFTNTAGSGIYLNSNPGTTVTGNSGVTTGNGGSVVINAPGQVVRLDGNVNVAANQSGGFFIGNGGSVNISSGNLYANGQITTNISGTEGPDTLNANSGTDANIQGLGGDDTITGNIGNDTIDGGLGNNSLQGGAGNDSIYSDLQAFNGVTRADGSNTLIGGPGNDTLTGGTGSDTYIYNAGDGNDTIREVYSPNANPASINKLIINDGSTLDNLTFTSNGIDLVIGNLSGGKTLTLQNQLYYPAQSAYPVIHSIQFGTSTPINTGSDDFQHRIIFQGTEGFDNLAIHSSTGGLAYGNGGDDMIFGNGGNDTLFGGAGSDFMKAEGGIDSLSGGSGSDFLEADEGILIKNGDIFPTGVDTMNGGAGNDQFVNQFGDTVYQFSYGWGTDYITDVSGNDTLDFSGYDTALSISLNNASQYLVSGAGSNNIRNEIANSLENIIKGNGNDTLTGNQYANSLSAGAGNDTLNGAAGNDTLDGGAGNDRMLGGQGDDLYRVDSTNDVIVENAGEGTDTVQSSANYTLSANVENLVLTGSASISGTGNISNNNLTGNSGNNALNGGDGLDTLIGGKGNDILKGGTGNDTYNFSLNDGQDTIQDIDPTAGNSDKILFDNTIGKGNIAFFMSGSTLQIGYAGSTDQISVLNQNTTTGQVERFQVSDGTYLTASDVNLVIQNMASYATNNGVSFTSLSDVENNANLLNIVASAWHS